MQKKKFNHVIIRDDNYGTIIRQMMEYQDQGYEVITFTIDNGTYYLCMKKEL